MVDTDVKKPRDLTKVVPVANVPEGGTLVGLVGDEPVMLTRTGESIRAFGARCTHLGAPLADGLVVGTTIRCPWHHACFSLKDGEALRAPAFNALPRWTIERIGDFVRVGSKACAGTASASGLQDHSRPGIVIIGGGAAGYAAAFELRRLGYEDLITMLSSEHHQPYDRTLLTKDYLDGSFGDDRLPIATTTLDDLGVMFLGGSTADTVDTRAKVIGCRDGRSIPYTSLLLATGAEPKRLAVPGAELAHVTVLRSLDDCRTILRQLKPGARVVVVGGSFIGLEAAASIRSRGIAVTVVMQGSAPMSRVVGPDLAEKILAVHRGHGVLFELDRTVSEITRDAVHLRDGPSLPADLVIVGVGVTPRIRLAEAAGLAVDDGVLVDVHLRTSDPDIYAAGDIAQWPDHATGRTMRIEHWVVAQRQGEMAARNMLGGSQSFDAVPFFWSKHFDFSFRYVGHAEHWDEAKVEGSLAGKSAAIRLREGGTERAVVTVERDLEALRAERAMEEKRNPDR